MLFAHETISSQTAGNHSSIGQAFRAMLLLMIALSTYLYIPLVSGGRLLVPSFLTVALIPVLYFAVGSSFSMRDRLFVMKITFVLLLSIAFSPGYSYLTEKFLSLIQFCLAISVTIMTVRLMQQVRRHVLERAVLTLWGLLLVGSALEVTGLTRAISDAFREWAFRGMYTLYDGDIRDVNFVGWVRPKVFSTEPSNVTKMFVASVNTWLLIRVTGVKAAVVAAATTLMFIIMGSPMYVVSAAITLAILVWNPLASFRTKINAVLATMLVSALFVTFFGETAFSTVTTRIDRIGSVATEGQLEIRSENLRAVIPWMTLIDTWSRWPIFGAGFGGKEVVLDASAFSDVNYRHAMGANAAAELGTYLGLLGGVAFVWLLLKQALETGVQRIGLMLVILLLFSLLMGGLDSFRYWGHIALLWGALAVADINSRPVANPWSREASLLDGQTPGEFSLRRQQERKATAPKSELRTV